MVCCQKWLSKSVWHRCRRCPSFLGLQPALFLVGSPDFSLCLLVAPHLWLDTPFPEVRPPSWKVVPPVTSTMFCTNSPRFAGTQISLQVVFFHIVQKLVGPRPETTLDTEDQGIHSDDVAPVSQTHAVCQNFGRLNMGWCFCVLRYRWSLASSPFHLHGIGQPSKSFRNSDYLFDGSKGIFTGNGWFFPFPRKISWAISMALPWASERPPGHIQRMKHMKHDKDIKIRHQDISCPSQSWFSPETISWAHGSINMTHLRCQMLRGQQGVPPASVAGGVYSTKYYALS